MPRIENKFGLSIVGALLLLAVAALAGGVFAGPLDPPAAPGSTQETQINSLPYTISASGSYVFTQELTGSPGSDGITVSAPDVTIDMRGFALVGPGGAGTENGINVTTFSHVSVRNGIIREWGGPGLTEVANAHPGEFSNLTFQDVGLNSGIGVILQDAALSDCVVATSGKAGGYGILLSGSSITRCEFRNNLGAGLYLTSSTATGVSAVANHVGIILGQYATLADSSASQNIGDGIQSAAGNVITRTTASANSGNGINLNSVGLSANHISDNSIDGNTLTGVLVLGTNNTLISNSIGGNLTGISASGSDNLIADNTIQDSAGNGINDSGSVDVIRGNDVVGATGAPPAGHHGIDASGTRAHIVENTVSGFDYDFYIAASGGSLVTQNTAANAASGNSYGAGNIVGPTQTDATGTQPWANINY